MTAFAGTDDFAALLGRDLTVTEEIRADLLLDMASDLIRSETRQTILAVTDDEANLEGTWTPLLVLPERPVVGVSAVTIDGVALATSTWAWRGGDEVVRWPGATGQIDSPFDGVWVNGPTTGFGHWGGPQRRIVVTYSHGYSIDGAPDGFPELPGDLKGVCLQLAIDAFSVPVGVSARTETLGDATITESYGPTIGRMQISDSMAKILARYRP